MDSERRDGWNVPARPPGDQGLPSDPARLRISDSDRHQVAELLRHAAGEGRIDLGELDERLEATYAARTYADLVPITADLPVTAPGAQPAREPAHVSGPSYDSSVAVMSETKRHGVWLVPAQHTAFALMGSVKLDLREARFATREVTLNAVAIMGDVSILVNAQTAVVVDGVAIMAEFGESRAKVAPELTAGSPVLRVKGLSLMASVTVQRRDPPGTGRRRLTGR